MRAIRRLISTRLMVPAYRAQWAFRPGTRQAAAAYRAGLAFRSAGWGWSQEAKRDWMLERVRETVRRAYRETVFYRELLDEIGLDPRSQFGFEDYSRIPPLDRDTVRDRGRSLLSSAVRGSEVREDGTGGSTGQPTRIWTGPEERGWRASGIEHYMGRVGVPPGAPTAYLWGHHLDPVASDGLRDRIRDFIMNVRWFDCFRLTPELLERYHQELQAWRPWCVVAYAHALADLAAWVIDRGVEPAYPTRCMITGAEKLWPDQRKRIERAFGRPVYERYGSRDVGLIAFERGGGGSRVLEVDWPAVFVEPEGRGPQASILVTKLRADAMPLIRYRIGDIGRFPEGSAPGHPVLELLEIIGRETDRIWLPGGGWIDGIQFPHLFKDHPIREYRVVQDADYSVEVQLIAAARFDDRDRRDILDTLAANLPGVAVTLKQVEEIPPGPAGKRSPVMTRVRTPE